MSRLHLLHPAPPSVCAVTTKLSSPSLAQSQLQGTEQFDEPSASVTTLLSLLLFLLLLLRVAVETGKDATAGNSRRRSSSHEKMRLHTLEQRVPEGSRQRDG